MSKIGKHFIRNWNQWSLYTVTIGLFISIPILSIVFYLFKGTGEMWSHITQYFLMDYIGNSIILIFGTGILCTLVGVSSAWIVSQYEFPGRKQLEWILFLPLAIPSYIMAYAYVGLLGNGGLLIGIFQSIGIPIDRIEMMNIYGLIWVLSFSLYPYVYASSKAIFKSYPRSIRETVFLLGGDHKKYFRKIALPLASPAIIGGLFLVFMEVLNDYGAAKYYGINTFTTGIFRIWTALEDLQSAIYLSALLVIIILGFSFIVKKIRGKRSYTLNLRNQSDSSNRQALQGKKKWIYLMVLAIPLLFGFVLPFIQLIRWSFLTFHSMFNAELLWITLQSLLVGICTSAIVLISALSLLYFSRWNNIRLLKSLKNMVTIGYVIPGAIIGISIIRSSQGIVDFFENQFNLEVGYLFYNSIIILIYAYIFRFIAVAYNPIEANILKIGKNMYESSYLLGISKFKTLLKVELPLMRNILISTFLLVLIDTLKELPLTLILKPYKLRTLAITAYEYADDERVAEAAIPAVILIGVIILFMALVSWIENRKSANIGETKQH